MARKFTARYDGDCINCGEEFQAGDEIGYVDDEINCEDCFDAAQDDIQMWD